MALEFAVHAPGLFVTLFFPHVYGDRLILPLYVLLLPYVAVAAARAVGSPSAVEP